MRARESKTTQSSCKRVNKRKKRSINQMTVTITETPLPIHIHGWQVRKKLGSCKTRAKGMRSQTDSPNERWAIDASSIFCGEDGWCPITAIIDCCDRCIVGWRLSSSGVSKHAAAALEEALVARREEIKAGKLTLRSDNGLIFGAKSFVSVAKAYGVEQEYITPYTPEQNGMIERFFRSLKEECVWQRGLNEHTNGLVRQYCPKSRRFDEISPDELMRIEELLNNRPRKVLE